MDKKKWKMIACHGRRNSSCAATVPAMEEHQEQEQQIVPVLSSVHPTNRPEDLGSCPAAPLLMGRVG